MSVFLADELTGLQTQIAGDVITPTDVRWDHARQAWNLDVDQRPVAIVYPESADDVVAAVRFATANAVCIAFNGGGHNAGTISWDRPTLLIKTEHMRAITIDPDRRRARVEAGVLAKPLAQAAGAHGLTFLEGTSPNVGVVGYALGGGLSWMVRKFGLCCNTILSVEVVTADGRLVRADHATEPDLFWALRGGSGNFGAVTAIELELFPIAEVYGGALFWPIERAEEVLLAWRSWVDTVPDECFSLGRLLQFPDAAEIPQEMRGRSFVLFETAIIGDAEFGASLIAPMRALGPEIDTIEMMPTTELTRINMDPNAPVAYAGDGFLMTDFTAKAITTTIDLFVGSPLVHIEFRHLGGAAARRSESHGALSSIDDPFITFTFGLVSAANSHDDTTHQVNRLLDGLREWNSGHRYLNFAETPVDPRSIFTDGNYDRLRQIKAQYDPHGIFQANHRLSQDQ